VTPPIMDTCLGSNVRRRLEGARLIGAPSQNLAGNHPVSGTIG
jgi:hypothetical protein